LNQKLKQPLFPVGQSVKPRGLRAGGGCAAEREQSERNPHIKNMLKNSALI